MGIVGKVRQHLASRYKTGVVYTHVQKCGGTSLDDALHRHFRLSHERIYPIEARMALRATEGRVTSALPETEAMAVCEKLTAYALERGVKCVTGHNPLTPNLRNNYADGWKFITLLREPVDRFCSHLRYGYRSGMETAINEDIDGFLETPRAKWAGALYASYFGEWLDVHEPLTPAIIDNARTLILSQDAVGFLHDLDGFEKSLSNLLGANFRIGHKNRTDKIKTSWRGAFTDAQMAKIRTLCQPNIDIYEYVREKLEAQ